MPSLLEIEDDEEIIHVAITKDFEGYMFFGFENGKVAKINLSSYDTVTRRRMLVGAYDTSEKLVGILSAPEDIDLVLYRYMNQKENVLLVHTSLISSKQSRRSKGVQVLRLGRHGKMISMEKREGNQLESFRADRIPSAGKQRKSYI